MVEWLTVAPLAASQDASFAPWRTIGEETDDWTRSAAACFWANSGTGIATEAKGRSGAG